MTNWFVYKSKGKTNTGSDVHIFWFFLFSFSYRDLWLGFEVVCRESENQRLHTLQEFKGGHKTWILSECGGPSYIHERKWMFLWHIYLILKQTSTVAQMT